MKDLIIDTKETRIKERRKVIVDKITCYASGILLVILFGTLYVIGR